MHESIHLYMHRHTYMNLYACMCGWMDGYRQNFMNVGVDIYTYIHAYRI